MASANAGEIKLREMVRGTVESRKKPDAYRISE